MGNFALSIYILPLIGSVLLAPFGFIDSRCFLPLVGNVFAAPIAGPISYYYAKRTAWMNDIGVNINSWKAPVFIEWSNISGFEWQAANNLFGGNTICILCKNGDIVPIPALTGNGQEVLIRQFDLSKRFSKAALGESGGRCLHSAPTAQHVFQRIHVRRLALMLDQRLQFAIKIISDVDPMIRVGVTHQPQP